METTENSDTQRAHDAASVLASLASSHSPQATSPSTSVAEASLDHAPNAIAAVKEANGESHPWLVQTQPLEPPEMEQPEAAGRSVDEETARAIAAATNEYGTRVRVPAKKHVDMVPTPDYTAPELSEKVHSKKRQAPSGDGGSGAKKPPSKRRKSEVPSDRATPSSARLSPTPSNPSGKPTKTQPTSKKSKDSKSSTPHVNGTSANGTPGGRARSPGSESDGSDEEVYCICRKPDNHTFMIGCDGGCEDWFHGKCVDVVKEDEKLIDKFICPNCCENGRGVTTWKPMCRRESCRKPARLKKGSESKYCSLECGLNFMQGNLKRTARHFEPATPRKRHKYSESSPAGQDQYQAELGPLGGTIRASELKALADNSTSINEFRRLGEGAFLTPPPSVSMIIDNDGEPKLDNEPQFSEAEKLRLSEISARQDYLKQKYQVLKDRGTFVAMMRARVPKIAQKLKQKDACGFDSTWSLDDVTFKAWRDSEEGKVVFENGLLEVPALDESNTTICIRKGRCSRHGSWQKLVYNDFRFESDDVGREKSRVDLEERAIRAKAGARSKSQSAVSQQAEMGWVEVVPQRQVGGDVMPDTRTTVKMEEDLRPAYEQDSTADEAGKVSED